eukprot:UN05885
MGSLHVSAMPREHHCGRQCIHFWSQKEIPTDIRYLCLQFVGLIMDSQILLNMKEQYILYCMLITQKHCKRNSFNIFPMTLLYRATPDSFDIDTFYAKTDHN